MTTIPAPDYHGKTLQMNLSMGDGMNFNLAALVDWLRRDRIAVRVHLEPGDATRYTFVLAYIHETLYVIRLVGYDVVGTIVLSHSEWDGAFESLTNGNEHTLVVCRWFLNTLIEQLQDDGI